jgi:hypothetical protein
VGLKTLAPASLLVLVTLPLAGFAAVRARRYHAESPRLLPANFAVIGTHLLFSVILTLVAAS